MTDDDFFNLLNQIILENDTATRKRPPEEEHLNLEEPNNFSDTVGFVNDETMFDAEVIGHIEDCSGEPPIHFHLHLGIGREMQHKVVMSTATTNSDSW